MWYNIFEVLMNQNFSLFHQRGTSMAKTCKSCGKEYKGEFCEHCGYGDPNLKTHSADKYKSATPVRFMTPEQKKEYYESLKNKEEDRIKKGGKKERDPKQVRLLIVIACAVVLLILGTLFGSGLLGVGEKSTDVVEKYFHAVNDRDFDSYASCFPKEMKADYEKDLADTGFTEKQYMDAFCADFAEEYGDDFKLEYNIINSKPLEEYTMNGYKEQYGTVPNISEADLVVAEVTYRGSKKTEMFRYNCYVGKVGRHFKLFYVEYDPGIVTTDMFDSSSEDSAA